MVQIANTTTLWWPLSNAAHLEQITVMATANSEVLAKTSVNLSRCHDYWAQRKEGSNWLTRVAQDFTDTLRNPPDKFFVPLVAICFVLGATSIIMACLILLQSTSVHNCVAQSYCSEQCGSDQVGCDSERHLAKEKQVATPSLADPDDKDFTVFTIYDPTQSIDLPPIKNRYEYLE